MTNSSVVSSADVAARSVNASEGPSQECISLLSM